jgi:uncharacterized membrane protein
MDFREIISQHKGKIVGVFFGLTSGLLIIRYGFWKALFIALCVGIGYYIGKRFDERVNLKEIFLKFLQKD